MYIYISQDVIYFYLILDKIVKSNSISELKKIKNFFKLNSISDIKTYAAIKNVLGATLDISKLRTFILNSKNNNGQTIKYLSKIHKLIEFYLKEKIKLSNKINADKLIQITNILHKYKSSDFAAYLLGFTQYLIKHLRKNRSDIISKAIYLCLEEYFDLFLEAKEIRFNEDYIQEKFKIYFDMLHVTPKTILFLNDKNNIKIMQEFFPYEKYEKISKILKIKTDTKLKDKYFLLEVDEKMCSKDSPELLCHEIGHLLNLKVYNFQNRILNMLYTQNTNIDVTILNYWLNEIIADIIGFNLCNSKKYINSFSKISENKESLNYPPTEFRTAILSDKIYDISKFNNGVKQVGALIQNNLKNIKNMLQNIN